MEAFHLSKLLILQQLQLEAEYLKWLNFPLKSIQKLKLRHDFVEILLDDTHLKETLIDRLKEIVDIERIASKIATLKVNPRELVSLKKV